MQNIIISTGSDGTGTISTIYSARVQETITNVNPVDVPLARSKKRYSVGKQTAYVDLLKRERMFVIEGFIKAENNSESCNTARKRLYDLAMAGGTDYLNYPVYNSTRIEVAYLALDFFEDPTEDYQSNSDTTTLNGAHNASVTTITVSNTSGFPTYGIIIVDNEAILYTGTSGTTFTGCTRGYLNTIASAHDASVTVASRDSIFDETGNQLACYRVLLKVKEVQAR